MWFVFQYVSEIKRKVEENLSLRTNVRQLKLFFYTSMSTFHHSLFNKLLSLYNTYLSSFSQNTISAARSKCRLVRDNSITLTAHLPTFASIFISSYFK